MLYNAQVVCNKNVGQISLLLEILHQVKYLCLNRHIQRGNRLIADDQFGIERKRARNADALALALCHARSSTSRLPQIKPEKETV